MGSVKEPGQGDGIEVGVVGFDGTGIEIGGRQSIGAVVPDHGDTKDWKEKTTFFRHQNGPRLTNSPYVRAERRLSRGCQTAVISFVDGAVGGVIDGQDGCGNNKILSGNGAVFGGKDKHAADACHVQAALRIRDDSRGCGRIRTAVRRRNSEVSEEISGCAAEHGFAAIVVGDQKGLPGMKAMPQVLRRSGLVNAAVPAVSEDRLVWV
jgi:hypothetical protein